MKKKGRPPLVREMSQALLSGKAPKPAPGKRRFFRTWVRAVPAGAEVTAPAKEKGED